MPHLEIDGRRLHYLDSGGPDPGAPVLVLLHAFPLTSGMWEAQLAGLGPTARVVAPDLPGFGESDPPAEWSLDAFADAVAALVDHLGLSDVVLGGLSMGGYTTFAFLRRHAHLVRAVVLADTRATADTAEGRARRSAQQADIRAGRLADVLDGLVANLLAPTTLHERPALVARVRSLMGTVPADTVVGALEALKRRPDATGELGGIDGPVLVVVGEDDALSPPDAAREMAAGLPRARVAVLPGAGHLSNLEQPEAFDDVVRTFLDEVARSEDGGV